MTNSQPLTISDLSVKFDCSPRTLRFYEEQGLLAPLRVNSHRFYSETDVVKLELILRGKRLGLSLRDIKSLILTRSGPAAFDEEPGVASLLPREKIGDQIRLLVERRAGIELAIAELKNVQARMGV